MIRSYKINRNYTNTTANMDILKPTSLRRTIRESVWNKGKLLLKDSCKSIQLVSSHYSYKVDSSTWIPQIMEKATIHVLERSYGEERYIRHTIIISGKKWRQNDLENEEDLGEWILQHPSAIERIYSEEDAPREMIGFLGSNL